MEFSISERSGGEGVAIFRFQGDITAAHGRQLRAFFTGLPATGATRIVVDLSGVNYMASVGLGELVNAHQLLEHAGGALAVASPQQRVKELFHLSRIDAVLQLHATVDAAVAALKPAG